MQSSHKYLFEDKLWGDKFWSGGYFHRTVGAVTKETVRKYVAESQKKHWDNRLIGTQNTLLAYAS